MSLLSYPVKCLSAFFFQKNTHVIDYSSCVIDYITPKNYNACSNRLQHMVIDYCFKNVTPYTITACSNRLQHTARKTFTPHTILPVDSLDHKNVWGYTISSYENVLPQNDLPIFVIFLKTAYKRNNGE